jgi:hypothetical protein
VGLPRELLGELICAADVFSVKPDFRCRHGRPMADVVFRTRDHFVNGPRVLDDVVICECDADLGAVATAA